MIRRPHSALFLLFLLAACEPESPPPGEPIGTFRFAATLRRGSADEGHCAFPGAPSRMGFDAVLSHDPKSGALWLTTDGNERLGRRDGTHFEVRIPTQGPGIPRELDTCTVGVGSARPCPLRFTEVIAGRLLDARTCESALDEGEDFSQGGEHGELDAGEGDAGACPRVLPDETLDWSHCGCIVGTLEERIVFPEDERCHCMVASRSEPAPERCHFVYTLEGRPG